MFILLTTANFPDIMLPEYEESTINCFIFMSFLILGLFFMMNVLLANVFSKFQQRLERENKKVVEQQEELLKEMLDRITKYEN